MIYEEKEEQGETGFTSYSQMAQHIPLLWGLSQQTQQNHLETKKIKLTKIELKKKLQRAK